MKKLVLVVLMVIGFAGTAMAADPPVVNIKPGKHPQLAGAQKLVAEAYDKIEKSQKHYKSMLGGHAGKAKALLIQANLELKMAADVADEK